MTRSEGRPEWTLNDGPPFANGLPHYGHLLTGFVKDTVPRFQTMRGNYVERVFGWDCHGLPAEMEAERRLELKGRADIEQFGIQRFNSACRDSVTQYTSEWRTYVTRQARWVDFDSGYRTMDVPYMESVLWAFKELWDRDLIYRDYRVLPYCPVCETPLSNFETRMDDAYRDHTSPASTVAFQLPASPWGAGTRLLVWTTTPWTLPSNLALAVGKSLDYVVMQDPTGERQIVLAGERLREYDRELNSWVHVATLPGRDLVGLTYAPLFDFFSDRKDAFRVLHADFVDASEGTGIVHLAPGFGEDDRLTCAANAIPAVSPVDDAGRFTEDVPPYAGLNVFDANPFIVSDLDSRGSLVRTEQYRHSYPHCWRTDNPLIYRAMPAWFLQVTALRSDLLDVAAQIDWTPDHVGSGTFRRWLENAHDWTLSRNRFWGAPIPVWQSDNPHHPRTDVYGSIAELERDFGVNVTDLHRPAVDALTRANPNDPTGASTMRRVPDVLDCWFESGAMPFAQAHYPFEHRDWFERHFPARFVVEYIGQTRGWFYTQHVLAVALFGKPAFTSAMAHGVLLGAEGRKMSKRLRNYPDPLNMFETYGADAMRWFLLSSAAMQGHDLAVTEDGIASAARAVIIPLWSSWCFFAMYANAESYRACARADSPDPLDRYIVARTQIMLGELQAGLERLDLRRACGSFERYLDALTNWYVRRSRRRFWLGERRALDTLAWVLEHALLACAPLLPLLSSAIYYDLTGGTEVHLRPWPEREPAEGDLQLVDTMELARDIASAGHSLRKASSIRARQPLTRVEIAGAPNALHEHESLLRDELNVREVAFLPDVSQLATVQLQINFPAAGPRLGKTLPDVQAAAGRGEWRRDDSGTVHVAGVELRDDESRFVLVPHDSAHSRHLEGRDIVVRLETSLDEDLIHEGLARDVIRWVQRARKEASLEISDRATIHIFVSSEPLRDVIERHRDLISQETLALALIADVEELGAPGAEWHRVGDGNHMRVEIARARPPHRPA